MLPPLVCSADDFPLSTKVEDPGLQTKPIRPRVVAAVLLCEEPRFVIAGLPAYGQARIGDGGGPLDDSVVCVVKL